MNDGSHTLHRDHARAILNKCAASIARITGRKATRAAVAQASPPPLTAACFFQFNNTPVPRFPIPDSLHGNEGHPARRFASACGAAGFDCDALMDGNENAGAAQRKAEGGLNTLLATHCAGAAPVLINSVHDGEIANA